MTRKDTKANVSADEDPRMTRDRAVQEAAVAIWVAEDSFPDDGSTVELDAWLRIADSWMRLASLADRR